MYFHKTYAMMIMRKHAGIMVAMGMCVRTMMIMGMWLRTRMLMETHV